MLLPSSLLPSFPQLVFQLLVLFQGLLQALRLVQLQLVRLQF